MNKLKISHRGLWNKELPENSIGAFKRSIRKDLPIELDVHILKDDTLVIFHDDNLKRMTGIDKNIKDCTYEEISHLYLLDTKEKIPTLKEVLKLVDGKVLLDIEIKTDVRSKKICKLLSNELDKYKGEFLVKSFSPLFINWFKKHRPEFKRGLLISNSDKGNMKRLKMFALSRFCINIFCKPDFLAISKKLVDNKRVKKIKDKGIKILVWTIRDDTDYDFDGIIFEEKK